MATPFIIAKTKGNFTLSIKSKIKDKTPIINDNNNWIAMGMFATKNSPNDIKVNIKDIFETIPDNVTEEDF